MSSRIRWIDENSELSIYHITSHVMDGVTGKGLYPFGEKEKNKLVSMIDFYGGIYEIQVVNYAILGNHLHLILAYRPKALKAVSLEETTLRMQRYYKLKKCTTTKSKATVEFRERLNSMSKFMQDILRRFSVWFNENHPLPTRPRRGSLWCPRFFSTQLLGFQALIRCMQYVDLNPVKASLVKKPQKYACSRFGKNHNNPAWKDELISLFREFAPASKNIATNQLWSIYSGRLFHVQDSSTALREVCDDVMARKHNWSSSKTIKRTKDNHWEVCLHGKSNRRRYL